MTLTLRYGLRSDVGHVREGNEDSAYAGSRLIAVADGMGGAAAGEVASRIVITRLADLDDDVAGPDVLGALSNSVVEANRELRDMVSRSPRLAGMGTTVTALLVAGQRLGLVHVGDSRCYLFRNSELTLVTRDHTLVQELVDGGEISEDEAAIHPKRSLLLRALDGRPDIDLDLSVREARVGDRYLLCSDGLSTVVSRETIAETLVIDDPQETADRLVELALRGGGPDNITAVVADVVESTQEGNAPILIGAAAADGGNVAANDNSAAGRAAGVQRQTREIIAGLRRRDPVEFSYGHRRRRWLAPAVIGSVLGALILTGVGGWFYIRTQYYVGVSGGRVAIFRGEPGTIGPLHLSNVEKTYGTIQNLAPEDRRRIEQHINASSLSNAREIVARIEATSTTTAGSAQ
jgi:serine/threonine protein phosphatase PrpC